MGKKFVLYEVRDGTDMNGPVYLSRERAEYVADMCTMSDDMDYYVREKHVDHYWAYDGQVFDTLESLYECLEPTHTPRYYSVDGQ